jgi:hypothetical protein
MRNGRFLQSRRGGRVLQAEGGLEVVVVHVVTSRNSGGHDDLLKRFGGPADFCEGIRLRTTRTVDIPVSGEALLDALPQGSHISGQIIHMIRAKRSLELYDPSVHVF